MLSTYIHMRIFLYIHSTYIHIGVHEGRNERMKESMYVCMYVPKEKHVAIVLKLQQYGSP